MDVLHPRTEARSPERDAETRQATQVFCDAAAVLPDPQRVVFLMHEIDALTLPDLDAALEIPLGTATSRLLRARRAFEAAVSRRRGIEDRKLVGASALPVFLVSTEALLDAGRTFPEVSPAEAARMWGRVTRATMTGAWAGALSRLAALTPRQVVAALVLAGGVGLAPGAGGARGAVSRGDSRRRAGKATGAGCDRRRRARAWHVGRAARVAMKHHGLRGSSSPRYRSARLRCCCTQGASRLRASASCPSARALCRSARAAATAIAAARISCS